MASEQGDYCEHAGHEWVDAGGGIAICAVCETQRDLVPDFPGREGEVPSETWERWRDVVHAGWARLRQEMRS